MDFSSMNGYEFEEFITQLLSKLGFQAQQTSLSGDGGVDIEAYCDKPFLKGYYLIQCKNWTNPVGQPQVRDLFGVVMSKRANKGILVTTSSFTDQAKEFANGLNIELIDGKMLSEIAVSYSSEGKTKSQYISQFYDDASFETERYKYLKKRMESNRDYNSYEEYLAFLLSYVVPQSFHLLKHGLDKEIIAVCDDMLSRFCKNIKRDTAKRSEHMFIKAYLLFVTGRIAACIECLNEIGLFEFDVRGDNYVPCHTETVVHLSSFHNARMIKTNSVHEDAEMIDAFDDDFGVRRTVYFYDYCTRRYVMIANLFILANTIDNNDLDEFETFISRGISAQTFINNNDESGKVVSYLANFTMEAINQKEHLASSDGQTCYKWYPYFFTLKKDPEYSIENTCFYNRAISVKESLVDNWDNLSQIRNDINNMARVLGFFQAYSVPVEANEETKHKYNIILKGIGPDKLAVIRLIRELTGVSFKDAKEIAYSVPTVLLKEVSKTDADYIVDRFKIIGATCDAE